MKIVILHNPVPDDALEDERDVLVQAEEVSRALSSLGFQAVSLPFELPGETFTREIRALKPDCVFNLVESVDGDGRLIHVAPSILDHLGLLYTGASAEAMFLTSNKVLGKKWMARCRIDTPQWLVPGHTPLTPLPLPDTYIIKALWEEASIGLDDDSVVTADSRSTLERLVEERSSLLGLECFAERYIAGREFNLSVLAGPAGPEVLPAAEIRFQLPEHRHAIVDYRAKWDQDSDEYKGTVRSFDFPADDKGLLETLGTIALRCWEHFELRGYARVDFRVDHLGTPWVLEVNANPCISPDSGFVAAATKAGIPYPAIIERIIHDTLPGHLIEAGRTSSDTKIS